MNNNNDNVNLPEHTKNSIGYKNLIQALTTVFEETCIEKSIQHQQNEEDWYDDFDLIINYKNKRFILSIGDTRTEGMMWLGPGGGLSICVKSKDTDGWAPFIDENGVRYDGLVYMIDSAEDIDYLKHEGSVGANGQAIEKSLQILKKYLDNQENVGEIQK